MAKPRYRSGDEVWILGKYRRYAGEVIRSYKDKKGKRIYVVARPHSAVSQYVSAKSLKKR